MSHSTESSNLTAERFDPVRGRRLSIASFGIAAVGFLISAIGLLNNREQFAFSWLFAFFAVFAICVGGLFWTILHHATDSEWSVLVRRQMENIASVIPSLGILFLPLLLLCAPILWKWWDIAPGVDPLLDAKAPYLNHTFFTIRYALFFLGLGGVAVVLRARSMAQDEDGLAAHTFAMRKAAIAGLPVLGVGLTFAAVDWLMGLDYHWFSTMWGVYIFAGAAGSSMALLVLVVTWLKSSGYLKAVNEEHYHSMGKFMFAFTVFWAYIGYSQYMLIWYANIPEETIYFKIRNTESWNTLSTLLVAGRFFAPFPLLLFQGTKKKQKLICLVAGLMIAMQLLDLYVIVLPSLHQTGVSLSVYDISALLAVGGYAAGVFFNKLSSTYTFPIKDPRLSGSVNLHN
jgi:fucose 4-O-acetylase-like acetyltransferase